MRLLRLFLPFCFLCTAVILPSKAEAKDDNPFLVGSNVPIDYANVKANHLEEYANVTLKDVLSRVAKIKAEKTPTFKNVFVAMDDVSDKMRTTSSSCFMFYWVSTDSASRAKGLAANQMLDSLSTTIFSDKAVFKKMQQFVASPAYKQLKGKDKNLVDDMVNNFKQSGVNLDAKKQAQFQKLSKEITMLSSEFSINMNTSNDKLILDEEGARGLPEKFKATYKVAGGKYEIPIINSTNAPLMSNADNEETRKAYTMKFGNRGSDKNLAILDQLVQKRHELAVLMGYKSYADYSLTLRMAKSPANVWNFLNDLVERSKSKAKADISLLQNEKKKSTGYKISDVLQPWDISYYRNQILKNEYQVDAEKVREYFPMKESLKGMFEIYQNLLGLEFKKVNNASVWHPEVEMYNVYEGDKLKGRFYLDLFPRPYKETWFYCVPLNSGKAKSTGYEVPVAMLLGNFTKPTATLPSMLSHGELRTLFHEFGHVVNAVSYHGDYSSQAGSKED
ncbi:MAG TPA: M3 family metallopeptidase, partial [Segetibacter sp.]